MNVKLRQSMERKIAARFIRDAIAAGYTIGIDNTDNTGTTAATVAGAEYEYVGRDNAAALAAMFQTDDDRVYLWNIGEETGKPFAWVWFVYGNTGYDVISDYTTNIEQLLKGANDRADRLESRYA